MRRINRIDEYRKKDELQKDTIYITKKNTPNIILKLGGDFRRNNADY